jgi:uncharacterized membrane protein YphA (DoxX/SURF4 family)
MGRSWIANREGVLILEKILNFLKNKYIGLACRWIIGSVFVYQSICKIYQPILFARSIQNYQLVSDTIARQMAIFLPWFELSCGIILIIGILTPGAIRIIISMLVLFVGAISINIIRGIDINCGCVLNCFTNESINRSLAHTFFLDFIYLLLAIPIMISKKNWFSLDQLLTNHNEEKKMV